MKRSDFLIVLSFIIIYYYIFTPYIENKKYLKVIIRK